VKKHLDPLGKMLVQAGVLDETRLSDVLAQQRHSLPVASLCYVLGHADEEALARVLSKQRGVPGLVLERSIIRLDVIADVPYELALRAGVLPVREDEGRVFVATEDPHKAEPLNEIQFLKGKVVVPHIALRVSVARAIRGCYAIRERGGEYWYGTRALPGELREPAGVMWVVSDVDELPGDLLQSTGPLPARKIDEPPKPPVRTETPRAPGTSLDWAIEEASAGLLEEEGSDTLEGDDDESAPATHSGRSGARVTREGPPKILIVDDDFATRHLLVKLLEQATYTCETAASGMEAVKRLKSSPPDLVVIDVMLPEINGFQICRSIKRSYKYQHIPVILTSAVIDSARVTEELLTKYSADAYFEKPIATDRLMRSVETLLGARVSGPARPARDDSFDRALELYRRGEIDQAIALLRSGLQVDPLSTRHHFVLANLLQRKNEIYEAIDEYESTVNLKPDYFPALSRLAYLYYKKGFSARAIETWRRALPHCPDPNIRQNIESFMRKLIAKMQWDG